MSNCYFLRSLFSLRKGLKYENLEITYGQESSFFMIFPKLCQTAPFWGRYLAWESIQNMKIFKNMVKKAHLASEKVWKYETIQNMVKRAQFSWIFQSMSNCYFLRSLRSFRKCLKIWKLWKYDETSSIFFIFASYVKLISFEIVI